MNWAWRKPPLQRFTILAVTLAALHGGALAWLEGPKLVAASNLAQLFACGLAFWACVDSRERSLSFGRSFWTLCAFSYLLWMVAQGVWTYKEFVYGSGALGQYSFTDVLFFFAFAPFALLFLAEPTSDPKRVDWARTLDLVQLGIVVLCAYFYVFYVPSRWETEEQTMRRLISQVFLSRNLLLIGLLWLRTGIAASRRERSLFATAAMAMTVYTVFTRIANQARLNWATETGNWYDLGWSAPFLVTAVLVAAWQESDEPEEKAGRYDTRRMLSLNLTPMLMPALVLFLGTKIAAEQMAVASLAILASFAIYSLRLWVTQYRQSRATEALARAEERFRTVFSSNPQPSWVFDQSTLAFVEVNDAAIRRYGYSREEFLAMPVTAIRPEEEASRFLQRREASGAYQGEWKHRAKSGDVFEVQIIAQPLEVEGRECTLVIAQDVTENKRVEAQLRHAQKMEAVGTLAGGIAHDFNNALTIISGYAQVVMEREGSDPALAREMRQIEGAAQRAAGLVRQLLAFSRQQVVQPQVMELRPVVESVQQMLRPLFGDKALLDTNFGEDLARIKADPSQMEQLLVNLALNAKEAMESQPGEKRLVIGIENADLGVDAGAAIGIAAGRYLVLTVSDDGCGMDKKTQERIFEPFFTTKKTEGAGLGLSTVYGIVQQTGGTISVESAPGEGASFRIYLPATEEMRESSAPATAAPNNGGETILVVEDDDGLRELTARILKKFGYQVFSAGRHHEAEAVCQRLDGKVDLLLTDVVMPEVSGKELADRLTAAYPTLIVLYMSGYTDEVVLKQGVLEGSTNFIQKPFTPSSLAQKVRQVLDAARSATHP